MIGDKLIKENTTNANTFTTRQKRLLISLKKVIDSVLMLTHSTSPIPNWMNTYGRLKDDTIKRAPFRHADISMNHFY